MWTSGTRRWDSESSGTFGLGGGTARQVDQWTRRWDSETSGTVGLGGGTW